MGGVGLSDQKTKYYTIDRKSKRNWMRIFFRFFGISLINSLIHYKNLSHDNINTVEYISSISTALMGDYVGRKRVGRPLALNNQKKMRLEKNISKTRSRKKPELLAHMPEIISTRRICVYCRKREKNGRDVYSLWCLSVCEKLFLLYHQNYVCQQ